MKTAMVTTFEVSDVVRANQPLPEVPYKEAIEERLTRGLPKNDRLCPGHSGCQHRRSAAASFLTASLLAANLEDDPLTESRLHARG
jgi:hypothetical protein